MKKLITILLLAWLHAGATNYYFSATGSDAGAGTQVSPYQTITKFNSITKAAGDTFFLKRGDSFYGSITISQSGAAGNPITIAAYGTGANPIITGFTSASGWTSLGSNIWESTSAVSTLSSCNMVVINGVNTPMGRWPNSTWATYQSFSGDSTITSTSLNKATTDWTGATAVIKVNFYNIMVSPIVSATGSTIKYSGGYTNAQNNWGFFIENDVRTLDSANEWYYNPSTKKIRVYSTVSPTNVSVATVNNLADVEYHDYITFQNIDFTGASGSAFYLGSSKHVSIQNCHITFCGVDGIKCNDITDGLPATAIGCNFSYNTFNHINNIAVHSTDEYGSDTITNNTISNVGLLEGMKASGDGSCYGIRQSAQNGLIQYNNILNTGYNGIGFDGANTNVSYNFIDSTCKIMDDGGGIYSSNSPTGKVISYNTVKHSIGNESGSPYTGSAAQGIYLDNNSTGVTIDNNNVTGAGESGIYLHNPNNITVTNNKVFDCAHQLTLENDNAAFTITGMTVTNNKFVAKKSTQYCARYHSSHTGDVATWGTFDNNIYARPVDDNVDIDYYPNDAEHFYTLAQYQSASGKDAHSSKSPKTVTDSSDIRLDYNYSPASINVSTGLYQLGIDNSNYTLIPIGPYGAVISIKNGTLFISGNTIKLPGNKRIK